MAVTAAALRDLHRIHRQLTELRERLERGPRMIQAKQANLAKIQTELDAANEAVQQAKVTVDRKQLELKTGEQKIVDYRAKLNTAASNKEYQTLLEQIDAAEMAGSVLSDEILEGFEKIDELEAGVQEANGKVEAGNQELEKTKASVTEEAEGIKADISRLEADLATAEQQLPGDFKPDYSRIIRSKGADGLAVVDDGVCTGCGQQITLNMQSELQMSKLLFCKSCGRLLYLPEP